MKRALLLGFFLIFACASLVLAAPKFPKLTGRVVDEAHVLSPGIKAKMENKLAGLEAVNGTQLVVAILPSLQGDEIQNYGYQLLRAWGIGQKGKNNGVVLIVVPSEKKVGIEVGYGHEADLTDAASSHIINEVMLPEFRVDRIEPGIWKGTEALVTLLAGNTQVAPVPVANAAGGGDEMSNTEVLIILIIVIILCIRYPTLAWIIFSNLGSGAFRGGGGRSGGFSGGGGSGGGGGSSGSW